MDEFVYEPTTVIATADGQALMLEMTDEGVAIDFFDTDFSLDAVPVEGVLIDWSTFARIIQNAIDEGKRNSAALDA